MRVVQNIISDLRACMSACRSFKRTPSNLCLCQEWNISCSILCLIYGSAACCSLALVGGIQLFVLFLFSAYMCR